MHTAQRFRGELRERDDQKPAAALWMGVTTTLAGLFLQNRGLVLMAQPLLDEIAKASVDLALPAQGTSDLLGVLQEGPPDAIQRDLLKFVDTTAGVLAEEDTT